MKPTYRLRIKIKDFLDPLPDPKIICKRITGKLKKYKPGLMFITDEQAEWVVSAIIEEAKISRSHGLFIRPHDLNKEINIWLIFINSLYNPKLNIDKRSSGEIQALITSIIDHEFEEIGKYYFDLIKNSKPKIVNANTAFRVHMEAVRCRILTQIFSEKPPFNKTEEAK